MTEHSIQLKVNWPGGRNSVGTIDVGNLQTEVSIPSKVDGPNIGSNPSDMLLAAAGTCYIITLAAMIERAKLPLKDMSLKSEGIVEITNGVITYKKIIHKPTVILEDDATEKEHEKLAKLAEVADTNCMISRAIKGNVEIELQATLK